MLLSRLERSYADLHIHTVFSDGTFTPREVVREAKKLSIGAVSITDHDSVDGIDEGMGAGQELGIEVVSGVELSAWVDDQEIHILGYLIDHQDAELAETLERLRESRKRRAKEIVSKLKDMGMSLRTEEVMEEAGLGSVGRPHIAEVLVSKGYVKDYREAFFRLIGDDCPAYVPKLELSPEEVFAIIKRAGGLAVLAHPGLKARDELIPQLAGQGLDGIEVWYGQDETTAGHYREIAMQYGLLMTGGSDCHGAGRGGPLLGTVKVPYSVVEGLKRAKLDKAM